MAEVKKQGGKIVFATFVLAMILTIMPLPEFIRAYRPEWVALVLIYWCIAIPTKVNIGVAWIAGLFIDVLTGTLLGQHALALAVIAFVAVKLHKQIRVYPLWQQALSVFTMIALGQLLIVWIKGIVGESPQTWIYWAPSITSAIIWPWVFVFLRGLRRSYRIA